MKLSRSYYESLLYDLLKPFVNLYDEAESSIIIPNEIRVSYDTRTMRLEMFFSKPLRMVYVAWT